MFELKKYLQSNTQVLYLVTGIGIAQAIPLLFSPVLSRIYTPADYALLAIVMSVANIFSEIISLRYDRAIVVAESEKAAGNLLLACLFFSVIIGIIASPVIYFIDTEFLNKSIGSNTRIVFLSTTIILVFMGVVLASGYWFQRLKAHKIIVSNKIVQMCFITFLCLLFGWLDKSNGLIKGYLAGWGVLLAFTFIQIKNSGFSFNTIYSRTELKTALRKHISFPKFNLLPALLHAIATALPVFMIIKIYGEHEGGNFNMCRQLLLLPAGFISSAFVQVYYRRLAETKEQNKTILPVLKQMLFPVLYLGIPATIIISLSSPYLFPFLLGDNWVSSGNYAQVYVFAVFMQFLSLCMAVVFPTLGLIKQESVFKFIYFLSVSSLFVFKAKNVELFMITYSIIEIIIFGLMAGYCFYKGYKYRPSTI